jgi:adenylosuccinate synthase
MKRAIVTVGLGFGDEGKGATVDYLCRRLAADLVIRYSGGSQAGHNVELPDGRRHTFSQFGAGTLTGVPTYLGSQVIIHPRALIREADHLRELGVVDPHAMLDIHPRCLVSTYYHQTMNQLRELSRGAARHGSCGHGIGETRSYWLRYGDDSIFAEDLHDRAVLRDKLALMRQRLFIDLQEFVDSVPSDALREYDLFGIASAGVAEGLLEVGALIQTRDTIPDCTTAIFEGAQGVLLDEWYGFHPHTTWSTVTPHHALEMASESGAEELCVLGIVRAYMTRHGEGPFPTYDESLTQRINDEGNPWNRWQGNIRAGWLDLPLLRYAVRACGGIDSLAVSCLDHLDWEEARVCVRHDNAEDLPLPPGPGLKHQERLTERLRLATPGYVSADRDALLGLLSRIAPVAIVAGGPTYADRVSDFALRGVATSDDAPSRLR